MERNTSHFNVPNLLTISRIVIIPVMVAAFYAPWASSYYILLALFVYASLTDFLDGFIARRWDQVSPFGRFLDPVADKLLIASVLLMLVGFGTIRGINLIPAVVILCREILVSGLREFLAEIQQKIPVTPLAKWKTAIQMVALGSLLSGLGWLQDMGLATLWVAAVLTLISGHAYWAHSLKHIQSPR